MQAVRGTVQHDGETGVTLPFSLGLKLDTVNWQVFHMVHDEWKTAWHW